MLEWEFEGLQSDWHKGPILGVMDYFVRNLGDCRPFIGVVESR
jgi:hypothetical protein